MENYKVFNETLEFLEKRKSRTVEDIFNEYLDNKVKTVANAVEVPVMGTPRAVMVEGFQNFGNIILPECLSALETELEFTVCGISSWKSEDGSENRLIGHFTHLYLPRGTCLICGWEGGKPAPLIDAHAQFACDVLAFAQILKSRGEL